MKVHFTLMVKKLLERLHAKILHCSMSGEFPLVGEMLIVVIHSQVQSIAWKFNVVGKICGDGGVPDSLISANDK